MGSVPRWGSPPSTSEARRIIPAQVPITGIPSETIPRTLSSMPMSLSSLPMTVLSPPGMTSASGHLSRSAGLRIS